MATPTWVTGLGVASITTIMAHFFGAKSVTLLGQDLSVGNSAYASGAGPAVLAEERAQRLIPCQGIDGGFVNTLPDYMAFIEEFRLIATHLGDDVTFYKLHV